jgi:hypothetical protein
MMKLLLLGVSATTIVVSLVCGFVGCGDDRNYPKGFLEEAAKEAPAAAATSKAAAPDEASTAAASAFGGDSNARRTPVEQPTTDGLVTEPIVEVPEVVVEELAAELNLAAPAIVAVAAGEEPFQILARSSKFDEFRRKAGRYIQLRGELLPYGKLLAEGAATPSQRATHNRIEHAAELAFKPLNAYMWDERWTEADRAAMGWILYGSMQQAQTP